VSHRPHLTQSIQKPVLLDLLNLKRSGEETMPPKRRKGTNKGLYTDEKSEWARAMMRYKDCREYLAHLDRALDSCNWASAEFWAEELRGAAQAVQTSCRHLRDLTEIREGTSEALHDCNKD